MDTINILKKGSLILELKLERCDHLVKKYTRAYLDSVATNKRKHSVSYDQPELHPPPVNSVCWGCLETGRLKNMHTPYPTRSGTTEVYADMVESCFAIVVKGGNAKKTCYICERCIAKLRESFKFKQQIILARNYFDALRGTPTLDEDNNHQSTNVDNSHYCEQNLLRPVAFQENGYMKPVLKGHSQKVANSETYNQPSDNESPYLWIDGKSMEFGVEGPREPKHSPSKEPHVLLQGSQVFFKSQTVFLDANQQIAPATEDRVKCESGSESILGSYLACNTNNVDVERLVVTPYISNIQQDIDTPSISYMDYDNLDMETRTSEDDYKIDSLTEYLTGKDFTIKQSISQDADSNIFDLIPFTGSCRCPLCQEEFSSIQERRDHIMLNHPQTSDKFMCEECGRIISSKAHLRTHVRNVHLKERRFACNICCREFYRRDCFKKHLQKVHNVALQENSKPRKPKTKVDKYSCSTCGMSCTLYNLKHHICEGIPHPQDDSDIAILPDVDDDIIMVC